MSDLISREALIKAFESHGLEWRYLKKLNPILEEVDKQPFVIEKPKERTAKVIDKSEGRHSITDFDWTGKCEKCGNEIQYSFDFCPYCGVKLEWE